MKLKSTMAAVALSTLAATSVNAQSQGISDTEIILGAIEDLSGPLSGSMTFCMELDPKYLSMMRVSLRGAT